MPDTSSVRVLADSLAEKLREEWRQIKRAAQSTQDDEGSGRLAATESRTTIVWSWIQIVLVLAAVAGAAAVERYRIGQLSDDVAEINSTLREVRVAQQANSTQVARLGDEVKRFDERLRRLEDNIEGEEVATARRSALGEKLDFKISEMNARLITVENRVGTLRKNVEILEKRGGDP